MDHESGVAHWHHSFVPGVISVSMGLQVITVNLNSEEKSPLSEKFSVITDFFYKLIQYSTCLLNSQII